MKEEENIQYLYDNLENDVLKGRVETILNTNIKQARLYKTLYHIFSTISIMTPIFVNIFQVMDGSIIGEQNLKIITMIFTTVTIIASTLIAMFSFKEQWKSRTRLIEKLTAELVNFQVGLNSKQDIDYEQLGQQVESIIAEFNKERMTFVDNQNVNTKSQTPTK